MIKILLVGITIVLSLASELLQALLPNDRTFDPLDIAANVVGSGLALALCNWYHKRMLERKRRRKGLNYLVAGNAADDLELGESGNDQELGIVDENDDDGGEAWDEIGGGESEGAVTAVEMLREEASEATKPPAVEKRTD